MKTMTTGSGRAGSGSAAPRRLWRVAGIIVLWLALGWARGAQAEDLQWAWMTGATTRNQSGTYGTQGTPAPANTPGGREQSVSWIDGAGALWLFGGYGFDGAGSPGFLNDLWKYESGTGEWTWMNGASTTNQLGTYGTQGTPAPGNAPGARNDAVSWIDGAGALWFFGGEGWDGTGSQGWLNDLWKYDPATGEWTWMNGASAVNQPGTYGTQGTPAPANTPGARAEAVSWIDGAGALWLFGGDGFDGAGSYGHLNDFWKYDPATGEWTWIKGAATISQSGTYGTQGAPAPGNTPGARNGAVSWIDGAGALWLFGGGGYDGAGSAGWLNDLWKYDPATGAWTWIKGASTVDQSGTYGTQGTSAPGNTPGARNRAVSWIDGAGAPWLFGGLGCDGAGSYGRLNDLWKYEPMTGEWTWMKGASTINQVGTYGTQGTPAPANTPGARPDTVGWLDGAGTLWLFGGNGYDGAGSYGWLNDLWRSTDITPPTAVITVLSATPTGADAVDFEVAFDEAVTPTFDSGDVSLTGTLAGSVGISGTDPTYTVTVTLTDPNADGTIGIAVAGAGAVTDLAGNPYAGGSSALCDIFNWDGFTAEPQDARGYNGDPHTFGVTADCGASSLSYQWKWDDGAKAIHDVGTDAASYAIPDVTGQAGDYWCEVSYDGGTYTSAAVTLEVEDHLEIIVQPVGGAYTAGDAHTFTVGTSGGYAPLTYTWKKDGITVGTDAALVLGPLGVSQTGDYTVEVIDDNVDVAISSPAATLTLDVGTPVAGLMGLGMLASGLALAGLLAVRRRK